MNRTYSAAQRLRWVVVDDNPAVGEVIELALQSLAPRQVDRFSSGCEALAAISSSAASVEMLITDRHMPGICGLELARCIRAFAPHVKTILATASYDELTPEEFKRAGFFAVLPKPFSLRRLEAVVRRVARESAAASMRLCAA